MATKSIRRAAVIGSGVMGSGIAAHLANAGIPVYLLDIVPFNPGPNDDVNDPSFRNRIATANKEALKKTNPSPVYSLRDLDLITVGNTSDHLEWLAEVDWIVEVVPENMKIKRDTFEKVEKHANPNAIISSNTSGLSIEGMLEGRSEGFRQRFLVTHFFNPVRYMKLLEIVEGKETDPSVTETIVRFGSQTLGKGIVFGKDTTNFIANRIGVHGMMTIMHLMDKYEMTSEGVDAVFGRPMGRPGSAVFRTADLVGLDTFVHVAKNCYDTLTEDEEREIFNVPGFMSQLVEKGWTGQKAGQGFYKKTREGIETLDLNTLEYRPQVKPEFASLSKAKGAPGDRIKKVVVDGDDQAAKFAREVTLRSLAYTARRLSEIADDVLNIDRGLRWGFNWDLGPFETWDALGVKWAYDAMKEADISVPDWVTTMVESGVESFYKWEGATQYYYDPRVKSYQAIVKSARELNVDFLQKSNKKVLSNSSATLHDMGDGIALLEFHTKMNSIDPDLIEMMHKSVDEIEANWDGLVIGNDADNFSAGANLLLVLMNAQAGQWSDIESMVKSFQDANQRMRYCWKPVVAAPAGLTLGGGAEVTLGANAVQAAGELYMGLVEVGVGLIPGGGGNLQLLRNVLGPYAGDKEFDAFPFLKKVFLAIGMGQVAKSAEEAREFGFLSQTDRITINRDHLLYEAKQAALGLAKSGFRPPRAAKFRLPGPDGVATIDMLLYSMEANGQISAHDRLIGKTLANVLCGGQTTSSALVDEQHLLDLEREAFMSLCGEPKSQARMQHMLMNNKPLRN
ncbi:MAG: enoyl-CoA hydratase/isomerase family protein [Bradymonadaceae bacterium]|nr:enoyl-CoA hydratase/isomerase family protein [Lujinxingiaceae bacterium]